MADITEVKVYFLEPYGALDDNYTTGNYDGIAVNYLTITGINGNVITFNQYHNLSADFVTPANMVLNIDANLSSSPASRAVIVNSDWSLSVLGGVSGWSVGQRVVCFAWTDRTSYVKSGTLSIPLSYDRQDEARFTIQTTANSFIPYAGMNVLIKYGSGFTLFGGLVKTAPLKLEGVNQNADTLIEIQVQCDTYNALARRRHILQTTAWTNTTAFNIINSTLQYMAQEGVTSGVIYNGASVTKFPQNKKVAWKLTDLYDKLSLLSGYQWYITGDKAFYFVPLILPYDNSKKMWEPYITDAPYIIDTTSNTFTDFRDFTLETAIDNYTNSIALEGGDDKNKQRVYSISRNDTQIKINQLRTGGSGVWGEKIENHNINMLSVGIVTAINGKTLTLDANYGLLVGDYVFINPYSGARITAISGNSITLSNNIGQVLGGAVGWYPQALLIMHNKLKEAGTAIPKTLSFSTFTIGNGSKIFAPNQRLHINVPAFGQAGTGDFLIEKVTYVDIGGELQINISGSLKDSSYFSSNPQIMPPDSEVD